MKWKSNINFEQGLKETIEWYLKNIFFFNKISKKHFEKRLGLKT